MEVSIEDSPPPSYADLWAYGWVIKHLSYEPMGSRIFLFDMIILFSAPVHLEVGSWLQGWCPNLR